MFERLFALAMAFALIGASAQPTRLFDRPNTAEYLGTGPHIQQGSPLRNVSRITAPVMLIHGDRDLNVAVIHSRRMDEALRQAGRQSQLTIYEGMEHDLADSSVRAQMLLNIARFLEQRLRP